MVKLTSESRKVLYFAVTIVSLMLTLFFAWSLIQYFFAASAGAMGKQDTSVTQAQTSNASSSTQTVSESEQSEKSADTSSDTEATSETGSKTAPESDGQQSESNSESDQVNSSSSHSQGSTPVAAPSVREEKTITVHMIVDGSAARGSSSSATVRMKEGTTVYDALTMSGYGVNARNTSFGMYVSAINGLAERDYGSTSGWIYTVNGVQPNYTSDAYVLHDGDTVVWTYVNAVK